MSGSKPAARGFVVAQAGAGGDEVEDFDDLGAEAAGELAGAAEGVLAGDRGLACGRWCRAAGRWSEEAVVGDDAVAGGEHVGQVGAHLAVDGDRSSDAELGAGGGGELAVGANADRDEHDVGREAKRSLVGSGGVDLEAGGGSGRRLR